MVFPSIRMFVTLPEELGIIENVNAIVKLYDKEIAVPCKHTARYFAYCDLAWPEIFDEFSNPFAINRIIYDCGEPNTSVFEGIHTLYDETYLEGEYYFVFDFCKNGNWHRNYRTKKIHFKEDKSKFNNLLEKLNKE